MVSLLIGTHEGVSCDGCSQTAFVGNRYKCLRCGDYDLCFGCYTTKSYGDQAGIVDSPVHDDSHPMQLILTSADYDAVYEGDPTKRYDERKIVSFTCPYCNLTGLTERHFGSHVHTVHPDPPSFTVICPLCIGITDLEHSHTRETENLNTHWQEHHSHSIEVLRPSEPTSVTTRPVQRRPMLARRTQRTGGATRTTVVPARGIPDELGGDMIEFIRNMRPEEDLRRVTDVFNNAAPMATANTMIRNAQRMMAGLGVERPLAIAETTTTTTTTQQEPQVQQVIRPMQMIPIYPPMSDESGDETPQPAADSADESDDGNEIREVLEETVTEEDDYLKNDEFWQTLKTRIPEEDVLTLLESMKATAKIKDEKEEKLPVWTPRPQKPLATNTPSVLAEVEGDPCWLPLSLETTPLQSTGCGGYWSDKRFLRPRKMQREQSVASSNAEIMEKAEVAMALFRASCDYEPVFSDVTKPDIALREALQHLKLGSKPDKMMEYQPAEEVIPMPEKDPITTQSIDIPDFTAQGYSMIVNGNVTLGVVPEADEAIAMSEDEEVAEIGGGGGETTSSGEDEDEEEEEDDDDDDADSQDSSIPEEMNIP